MGIVAKYKFNQNTYADFIPEFNSGFTNYTITDEIGTDGFTIRTIESDSLPTLMRFGATTQTDREKSLLEVYECDISNVANMYRMFLNCSSLISLDASNFNTSNATTMEEMFNNCTKLTSLDVSNFNTSKVTNMSYMFINCTSLTSLDVSNFNTNKVTGMRDMFNNCNKLTSLDLSSFDTSNVDSMYNMFSNCSSLTSLDVSSFNTSKVTNMNNMFHNCNKLTSLDVSNFDTNKVTGMISMFHSCSSLTSLDVSNFNTSDVTGMSNMFRDCFLLTSLDVSSFNTSKVTNMGSMFRNCKSLTSLDVSNFNTENVTTMDSMFSNCSSLISLDLSNFNTSNVTNMGVMFSSCSKLTLLDVSNFNIENETNIGSIFYDCKLLTNIGAIYCNSSTINKISDLITTNTAIWYSDAKLKDLTKKENITYKEYKMNILESDEEIVLRRVGDVCDELNLETGELTQYFGEFTLNGQENWVIHNESNEMYTEFRTATDYNLNAYDPVNGITNSFMTVNSFGWLNRVAMGSANPTTIYIVIEKNIASSVVDLKTFLQAEPIKICYQLAQPTVKTINLKGKPSINWQGDTYFHLENNTLYPQLDCEIESINYYEIPKLKANTLYTLRYVGEPTECIFGGLTYRTKNNMILTSGSSDSLLYFDKEVRKVILIEGDVRDRNFDYFEGIESLEAVEIVTHKTNMPIFAKGGRK